jgi:hypothetical protein
MYVLIFYFHFLNCNGFVKFLKYFVKSFLVCIASLQLKPSLGKSTTATLRNSFTYRVLENYYWSLFKKKNQKSEFLKIVLVRKK